MLHDNEYPLREKMTVPDELNQLLLDRVSMEYVVKKSKYDLRQEHGHLLFDNTKMDYLRIHLDNLHHKDSLNCIVITLVASK